MNTCLQAKVTKVADNLNVIVSQVCSAALLNIIPLLVDEGYLLVDFNGVISYIYVDKE